MKQIGLWLLLFLLLYSCQHHGDKISGIRESKLASNALPDSLIIAPLYPDSVYFAVQSVTKNRTVVKGDIEGFHNKSSEVHELYFQRFVNKQENYRIIHCVGTGLETVDEFGTQQYRTNSINDTIQFDELGIFRGQPGDPIDLIPLYPGHTIKPGKYWTPQANVKIDMGSGVAKYSFVIDSVFMDEAGAMLARMQIKVEGGLKPSPAFKGGKVTISGGGWILWDCTINQRRETHLKATYLAVTDQKEVQQWINVDDHLQVNEGRKKF